MAIIVTQTADNAYHIKDAFRSFDRDYYPMGVYEAIYDLIQDTHGADEAYELDVIGWCCDISDTDLESENRQLRERGFDEDDLYTLDDLVSDLDRYTTILYVDEDAGVVYHLAY